MRLLIKPSDLRYKYRHNSPARDLPPFVGKPDERPFDRDSLHEVINMSQVVMADLGSDSGVVLETLEEVMVQEMPAFLKTREEVFDFLTIVMTEKLARARD
ncbi:hypothetical protein JCM30471_24990 [Desulfuromonas carbonis]|uniref:hypothetical protein n=1 Tax=Desulfuromonas sp. DDH964 TaxID=1823759 RepID=UPI00078D197F|nr:hypothetical protein [Desulfuromonas sp. DDH964]AMV70506.1 hypothetical protein DBW_0105 [Desulfuromonas sp. DDH964]